jgi:hypothetical protein
VVINQNCTLVRLKKTPPSAIFFVGFHKSPTDEKKSIFPKLAIKPSELRQSVVYRQFLGNFLAIESLFPLNPIFFNFRLNAILVSPKLMRTASYGVNSKPLNKKDKYCVIEGSMRETTSLSIKNEHPICSVLVSSSELTFFGWIGSRCYGKPVLKSDADP